jgi:hypothetical protein
LSDGLPDQVQQRFAGYALECIPVFFRQSNFLQVGPLSLTSSSALRNMMGISQVCSDALSLRQTS